ncbi:hypothetical protein K402DRAFT_402290 [Aulographum hederae CBS 113979]|uniref:Uncharacterized protein n=1 Tax=Aulographum hederae CBS 113979 TaxID=1176131 RepID=A0A6G1H7R0_9PEZI|nr:hypothetical protein K402DRAFT_402290 [Aulographum hederae CBS 113979]
MVSRIPKNLLQPAPIAFKPPAPFARATPSSTPKKHNLKSLFYSYSPEYHLAAPAQYILSENSHPLRPKILSTLETRPREGLWIYITRAISPNVKAAKMRHAVRRLRVAVQEALKDEGLDKDGRWMASKGEEPHKLEGTLTIVLRSEGMAASWEELTRDSKKTISEVVWAAKYGDMSNSWPDPEPWGKVSQKNRNSKGDRREARGGDMTLKNRSPRTDRHEARGWEKRPERRRRSAYAPYG